MNEHIRMEDTDIYSLVTAATAMARPNNHFGKENAGIALLMVAFAMAAPLLRSLLCLFLWFLPMSKPGHRLFAGVIDVLNVIAAADVFGLTAGLVIVQFPKLLAHVPEINEMIKIRIDPCPGLFLFTAMGFLDTIVSSAVHHRYMACVRRDREAAENQDVKKLTNGASSSLANPGSIV